MTGPAWADSLTQRLVLSWFNRRPKLCDARLSANLAATANANPVSADLSFSFLTWADADCLVGFMVEVGGVTGGIVAYTYLYLDGASSCFAAGTIQSGGNAPCTNANQRGYSNLSEGFHSVAIGNGATTPTYYATTYGTSMSYAAIQG